MFKKMFFSSLILLGLSLSLSQQANAVTAAASVHVYSIPGMYAEDVPEGWVLHSHARYLSFDKVYSKNGSKEDAGMTFSAIENFEKVIRVQRFGENDKWQYTSVGIFPFLNVKADIDNGPTLSASGVGDPLWSNYIGTWWNDHNSHAGIGATVTIPIGDYNEDDALNVGGNHWVIFFPYAHAQFRYKLSKGLVLFEPFFNIEWRFENPDTGFKDHDVSEFGFTLTYFPSDDGKIGIFIKPNYQFAINKSSGGASYIEDDDNFYCAAAAAGVTWNINKKENVSLTWTSNIDGKGYDGGALTPQLHAVHFVWSHFF
jgi:hypothetical protein